MIVVILESEEALVTGWGSIWGAGKVLFLNLGADYMSM